jgi:pilus assembly protein FimV
MLALQEKNPQAFGKNNINILRTGQVLRIPTEQDIYNVQRGEADVEVARQMQAWRGDGSDLPQLDARVSSRSTSAPAKSEDGRLKLSSASGSGLDGAIDGDADDQAKALLNARLKEVISALEMESERNNELSANVDSLRAEMKDLRNKLKLRNEQLAKLQAGGNIEELDLSDLDEALAQSDESLPFEVGGDDSSAATGEREDDEELAKAAPPAKNEPPENKKPKDKPKGSAFAPPEPTWVDQLMDPTILAGAAGVLALLGGGLWLRSRRNKSDEQWHAGTEPSIEGEGEEEFDVNDPHRQANDPENQKGARYGLAQEDDALEAEIGDPIAESDIYMAYGRYPQAVELLERALKQEPDRVDLHQKLAEVYRAAGDDAAAAEQEDKLARMGGAVAGAGAAAGVAASMADDLDDIVEDFDAEPAPDVMEEFRQTLPEEDRQLLDEEGDDDIQSILAGGDDDFEEADFDAEELLASEADLGDLEAVETLLDNEQGDSFNDGAFDLDLDLDTPSGEDALSELLGDAEIPDLDEPLLEEAGDLGGDLDFAEIEAESDALLEAADLELDGLEAADDSALELGELSDGSSDTEETLDVSAQLDSDMASELLEAGILDEDFSLEDGELDLSAEFADVDASLEQGEEALESLGDLGDEVAEDAEASLDMAGEAVQGAEGDLEELLDTPAEAVSDLSDALAEDEAAEELSLEGVAESADDEADAFTENIKETLAEVDELASQDVDELMDVSALNVGEADAQEADEPGEYSLTAEDLEIDIDSELAQLDSGLIDGLGLDDEVETPVEEEKPGVLDGLSLADAVDSGESLDMSELPVVDTVEDSLFEASNELVETEADTEDKEGPLGLDLSIFEDDLKDAGDSDDEQRASDIAQLDVDETATKLDLARAYIDMGDNQSAQEMLDEVMREGSALDKQQAQELQDKLS